MTEGSNTSSMTKRWRLRMLGCGCCPSLDAVLGGMEDNDWSKIIET